MSRKVMRGVGSLDHYKFGEQHRTITTKALSFKGSDGNVYPDQKVRYDPTTGDPVRKRVYYCVEKRAGLDGFLVHLNERLAVANDPNRNANNTSWVCADIIKSVDLWSGELIRNLMSAAMQYGKVVVAGKAWHPHSDKHVSVYRFDGDVAQAHSLHMGSMASWKRVFRYGSEEAKEYLDWLVANDKQLSHIKAQAQTIQSGAQLQMQQTHLVSLIDLQKERSEHVAKLTASYDDDLAKYNEVLEWVGNMPEHIQKHYRNNGHSFGDGFSEARKMLHRLGINQRTKCPTKQLENAKRALAVTDKDIQQYAFLGGDE